MGAAGCWQKADPNITGDELRAVCDLGWQTDCGGIKGDELRAAGDLCCCGTACFSTFIG